MKPQLVVSDWNGTLIEDLDDKPVLKQIAMDELFYSILYLKWKRVRELKRTKDELERMVKEYRDDPESQAELLKATFELYNKEVIAGMSMERINKSVEKYSAKARKRLLYPIINAIAACKNHSPRTGILTSAYKGGVEAALGETLYSYFDFVCPSVMDKGPDGKALGIRIRNYGNKPEVLKGIIDETHGASMDNVIYIGDDYRDEKCADLVGRFVVSPLAADEFKQSMSKQYGSKVRTPAMDNKELISAMLLD